MQHHPIDYEVIERRVVRRVQRRFRFFIHTAVFIIGIPLIGGWGTPAIFLFWVAAWIFHLLYYTYHKQLEQEIEREIEREADKALKRKHGADDMSDLLPDAMQVTDDDVTYAEEIIVTEAPEPPRRPAWLGDDGELIDIDDEHERLH